MLNDAATARLQGGARSLGLALGAREVEAFGRYHELLLKWGRRINLTRIMDPQAVVDRHFLDCLALAPRLGPDATVLDVGSGAGFPGVVVALVRPDVTVTLCESVGKKAAFLRALVHHLGLRCEVVDQRSETLLRAGRAFGAVASRAVLPLPEWIHHAAPFVGSAGQLFAMVAEVPAERPAPPGFAAVEVHPYALPDGSPRALLCWRRST